MEAEQVASSLVLAAVNASSSSQPHVRFPSGNMSRNETAGVDLDLTIIIPLGILLSIVSLVTFVGNVMVLHAIRTEKKLQTVSNIFIMSLAIADCSVGLFVMPISAVYALLDFWPFGLIVCNIWLSMDYVASTASIFNLFALSLDRFWSIISPLKYLKKRTRKRALIMCSAVWLTAFLWIIPVVGWHQFYNDGQRHIASGTCDTEFSNHIIFKILTAIFNFYVPMVAMIALYGRIFQEIKSRAKSLEVADSAVSRSDVNNTSMKKQSLQPSHPDVPPVSSPPPQTNGSATLPATEMVLPQIIVETPDEGNGTPRKRRIVEYDGITLVRFVSTENIMKEEYEHVGVSVEFDSDSDKVDTLQLPDSTIDDDCVSLSDYGEPIDYDDEEEIRARKAKKHKKMSSRFPKLTSTRRPFSKSSYPKEPIPATRTSSNPTSPSSQKRLLNNLLQKPPKPKPAKKIDNQPQPNKFKREKKAAFQLGIILGAFCLCFMPYFVSFIITAFCQTCITDKAHLIFTWLGYLNSTINPFLYPWTNANFRSAFRKMFCIKEPKKPVCNYYNNKKAATANRRAMSAKRSTEGKPRTKSGGDTPL